jgi:oxalate decarboxylase
MSDEKPLKTSLSRRNMLGIGSTLATAAFAGAAANAQQRANTRIAERDRSASDPGPENRALLKENLNSNTPPPTDNGDVGAIWYSFDLAHKRIQRGRLDSPGHAARIAILKGPRRREHAPDGRKFPRTALAHRG